MEEIILKASDGYNLSLSIFTSSSPKAVVQIAHGMEEHKGRYYKFCKYLSEHNFIVVASNMRGHGENVETLGYFAKKNGDKRLILDQKEITEYIIDTYNLPVYLFAHSMGTIISRCVLQQYSKLYQKVVLSGYPNYQGLSEIGIVLAKLICLFNGQKSKSKLLKSMVTGSFSKKTEGAEEEGDWLSYNKENIIEFGKDKLCGFGFTNEGYLSLIKLVSRMHKVSKYKDINLTLPILLLNGEDDASVGGEKGLQDSYSTLYKAGFKTLTKISYNHMRHEILQETDHLKVYEDILKFYNE